MRNTHSYFIRVERTQAQAIGQRALREIWQGREAYDLKLPARWLKLDPTDLIDVPVDGVTRRLLLTAVTYGRPGLVLVRGIVTDGGVPEFVTVDTGSGAIPPSAPEPPAPIRVELLDMPLMLDAHDASGASFYVAACPVRERSGDCFKLTLREERRPVVHFGSRALFTIVSS